MVGPVNNSIQQYVSPYLRSDQSGAVAQPQTNALTKSSGQGGNVASSGQSSNNRSGRGSLIDITV